MRLVQADLSRTAAQSLFGGLTVAQPGGGDVAKISNALWSPQLIEDHRLCLQPDRIMHLAQSTCEERFWPHWVHHVHAQLQLQTVCKMKPQKVCLGISILWWWAALDGRAVAYISLTQVEYVPLTQMRTETSPDSLMPVRPLSLDWFGAAPCRLSSAAFACLSISERRRTLSTGGLPWMPWLSLDYHALDYHG